MGIDAELHQRCLAVGLDPGEMARLGDESGMRAVFATLCSAEIEADIAASERAREQAAARAAARSPLGVGNQRWREQTGPSTPLTIRFDHDELVELRRRADAKGMGVSVLARAYVRQGLAKPVTVAWD